MGIKDDTRVAAKGKVMGYVCDGGGTMGRGWVKGKGQKKNWETGKNKIRGRKKKRKGKRGTGEKEGLEQQEREKFYGRRQKGKEK